MVRSALRNKILGLNNYTFLASALHAKGINWKHYNEDFFFFMSLLKNDFNVLDIGANEGVMTCFLSKKLSGGKVYAFEPVPLLFRNINKLSKLFRLRNVRTYNMALGREDKVVHMCMPIINNVHEHTRTYVPHIPGELYDYEKVIEFEVSQKKLDHLEELRNIKIHAIKIDVENYEHEVLMGALEILKKDHPLIYTELWMGSENASNCLNLLKSLSYGPPKILDCGILIDFDNSKHKSLNFFFLP